MSMLRRIALWILTNVAIIAMFSFISSLLGIRGYLTASGINYTSLLFFAAFFGFVGSFISLMMSKRLAKWNMGVQVIDTPRTQHEVLLVQTVQSISQQLGITMPEVGIYPSGEVNAFATGASKNNSLVAVSQGLLQTMNADEIEGVIAHEMAHIANGDMVTMTLMQGVINTFVIFAARVVAQFVLQRDEDSGFGAYYLVSFVLEIIFGFLAGLVVMAFSRWREYRADAGGAQYVGRGKMTAALQALQRQYGAVNNKNKMFATMKSSGLPSAMGEFMSTHPPLEKRILALKSA